MCPTEVRGARGVGRGAWGVGRGAWGVGRALDPFHELFWYAAAQAVADSVVAFYTKHGDDLEYDDCEDLSEALARLC
jgi:hypothetical protein